MEHISRRTIQRARGVRAAIEAETERRCKVCALAQPIEEYKRHQIGKARSRTCWSCEKQYIRNRRASLRPPVVPSVASKKCQGCGRRRPPDWFQWRTDGRRRSSLCRECRIIKASGVGLETCSNCKQTKPPGEFYWNKETHKRTSWCKACMTKGRNEWNRKNPGYGKVAQRAFKMGMSVSDFRVFLATLSTTCEICGAAANGRVLHLDHDHATGYFRGVLCHRCNVGLGGFADDPSLLRRCADYLELPRRWDIKMKRDVRRPR